MMLGTCSRLWIACVLLLCGRMWAQVGAGPTTEIINVKSSDLEIKGITDNWLSYNGDYTGRRHSSLTQITPANVSQMRAQWIFHTRNAGVLEVTPVVVNGVMFVTASNDAFALDARTGRVIWHYARPV